MDIIIGFSNYNKTCTIKRDIIEKHPNSIIYGYVNSMFHNNEPLIFNDINYDDFYIIVEILNNTYKSWIIPDHIQEYMNKYCFETITIFSDWNKLLKLEYENKINNEMNGLYKFINGDEFYYELNSDSNFSLKKSQILDEYMENTKNIVSVQIVSYRCDNIVNVNYVPIFYKGIMITNYLYQKYDLEKINIFDVRKNLIEIIESPIKKSLGINLFKHVKYDNYMNDLYKIMRGELIGSTLKETNPIIINLKKIFDTEIDIDNAFKEIIFDATEKIPNKGYKNYYINVKKLLKKKS